MVDYKNIKRWYLEMTECPENLSLDCPVNVFIEPFSGGVVEYRRLNQLIGGDLGWLDRQIMSDKDLEAILNDEKINIYVLYYEGKIVGYTELDFRNEKYAILEYFGLAPSARGKGLGKFLLHWTINEAWRHNPKKVKLNTSEQDHPNALPTYLKAGFKIIEEKIENKQLPKSKIN